MRINSRRGIILAYNLLFNIKEREELINNVVNRGILNPNRKFYSFKDPRPYPTLFLSPPTLNYPFALLYPDLRVVTHSSERVENLLQRCLPDGVLADP